LAVQVLFHGTGARRRQSIEQRGLLPKLDSYVYASSNPLIALVFAAARAEHEDDWGLLVAFKACATWETDPKFPLSQRSKDPVAAANIINIQVMDPEKEIAAFRFLSRIVDEMKIRLVR